MINSPYNFSVHLADEELLYNAFSGALISLRGNDRAQLSKSLTGRPSPISIELLPEILLSELLDGGFVTPSLAQQREVVRERYWRARRESPLAVTIATTLDCNLGCYYCYEERKSDALSPEDVPKLVARIRETISEGKHRSLHVDWYGGEPLLNMLFIESASEALQQLCAEMEVSYSASAISNGTRWPEDVGSFISRHRIRQVQISFDGMQANHDKRRHYREKPERLSSRSPFMLAANLVGTLLHHVRVDVRFNSDKGNAKDMLAFLDFANENGWFSKPFPAVFQPARIAAYSDKSAFMQRHQLSLEAFDALRAQARKHLPETVLIEESEVPDGYPYPKTSVCAALAEDSFVVGADGQEYRCGLQVSERHRAVGALTKSKLGSIPVVALEASGEASQGSWWAHYDPTAQTKCSRCSFLPICLGGCPKKHLENDTKALAEQCAYWRTNLPRLIGRAADTDIRAGTCYCDDDQIRF